MKKVISFILALITLFATVSCSQELIVETEEEKTETLTKQIKETAENKETEDEGSDYTHDVIGSFAVGYDRQDITPAAGTPMAGYANDTSRLSKKILDHTFATCIAIKDAQENKALIFTLDLLSTPNEFIDGIITVVAKKTGIPESNIIFSATHTHEGASPNFDDPVSMTWRSKFTKAVIAAAENAIKTMDKAEIYCGTVKCENMNFVRRYITAEGGYLGDNYGSGTPVAHETEPDSNMSIVKFARENEKDVVIVNWGAHPSMNGGSKVTDVSADYPGVIRDEVEDMEDVLFAFYEGAAGNLNPKGRLDGEKPYTSADAYGKALAVKVLNGLKDLKKVNAGTIKGEITTLTLNYDHSLDHLLKQAQEVKQVNSTKGSSEANALAKSYGMDSHYTANHIVNKASKGKTKKMKIWAISCGDIAFIGAPYEMFTENGKAIKAGANYEMTFVCEQANGGYSYIPSSLAWSHGGYEVTGCLFEGGTAEIIQNAFIDSLNRLK